MSDTQKEPWGSHLYRSSQSDTSKTHHSSVTPFQWGDDPEDNVNRYLEYIKTTGVDIDQSSHGSVTHTYMSQSYNGSYMSQSYMDRLVSKLIGKQSSTGMSFLRFVIICAVVSLCLPFIVIIMAVMVVAYIIGYLLYGAFVSPTLCLYAWWDYKQLELAVMEADKDMVTKDMVCPKCGRSDCPSLMEGSGLTCATIVECQYNGNSTECRYCDSPEHVISECPHI